MLTIRSRFFSLKVWSMGLVRCLRLSARNSNRALSRKRSRDSLLMQPAIQRIRLVEQSGQMRRHWPILGLVRLKRRGLPHGFVPVFGPDAVRRARTRWPGEHGFGELHVQRIAQ